MPSAHKKFIETISEKSSIRSYGMCLPFIRSQSEKKNIAQELDNHSQKRNKTKIFRFISMHV